MALSMRGFMFCPVRCCHTKSYKSMAVWRFLEKVINAKRLAKLKPQYYLPLTYIQVYHQYLFLSSTKLLLYIGKLPREEF